MSNLKLWDMQLFADGTGDGGASASSAAGSQPADNSATVNSPEQRLRDLGVPEDKLIRYHRAGTAKARTAVPDQSANQPAPEPEQDAAAEEKKEEKPSKPTWDDIKADPDYNKEIQKIVKERTKKSKVAEDNMAKLVPAIEVLSRRYGMDINNLDYDALAQAVDSDEAFYEDDALDHGEPVKTYMQADRDQRSEARRKSAEEEMLHQHYESLEQQAEAMKSIYPSFDLETELQNPQFFRLTAPGVNIDVDTAYRIVHDAEIRQAEAQATAERVKQQIAAARQVNLNRPKENGTSTASSGKTTWSYANATPQQKEAFKAKIREYAANGKVLHPGEFIPM